MKPLWHAGLILYGDEQTSAVLLRMITAERNVLLNTMSQAFTRESAYSYLVIFS